MGFYFYFYSFDIHGDELVMPQPLLSIYVESVFTLKLKRLKDKCSYLV